MHAGGKRGRDDEESGGPSKGSRDADGGGNRSAYDDLDEDTKEFLEFACEEEDLERLRRTGMLRKEVSPGQQDDSGDTSVEEPLPPNETIEQFLNEVVPHPEDLEEDGGDEGEATEGSRHDGDGRSVRQESWTIGRGNRRE